MKHHGCFAEKHLAVRETLETMSDRLTNIRSRESEYLNAPIEESRRWRLLLGDLIEMLLPDYAGAKATPGDAIQIQVQVVCMIVKSP
jgi:hypothetical protein